MKYCAVCHEPIDEDKPLLVLNYPGRTFYFCTELHREEFEFQTQDDDL